MKVSRDQVARNRQRIIEAAARLFREKGFDGVSVADIMSSAGLTHGGFYGHFASKEDLAAQACLNALTQSIDRWTPTALCASDSQLADFITSYLSPEHRDNLGGGCALAALATDAARQPATVRQAFTEGIRSTAAMLSELSPGRSRATRHKHALAILAGLVGAVALARATEDPVLSDEILRAALAAFAARSGPITLAPAARQQATGRKKSKSLKAKALSSSTDRPV
jgi:TetR/AcrR family transcriptional regulator, transcriptional repressor for nem operon